MKNDYFPRIFDETLKETLNCVGAVAIVGPKWCGKTTTAEQQAKSAIKMQDPGQSPGYLVTADMDWRPIACFAWMTADMLLLNLN